MSPTSTRTAAALLIVGALVVGIVLGVVGDHVYLLKSGRLLPPRGRGGFAQHLVDRLDKELHFTAQQKTAVTQIVERHRAKIDAISATVRPQIRQEIDATNADIEKVLTPEQVTKFHELQQKRRQHPRRHGSMGVMGSAPQAR